MKKRITALFLLCAFLFSFAACTPSGSSSDPTPTSAPEATPTEAATPTPANSTEGLSQLEIDLGLKKYTPTKSYTLRPGLYVENNVIMHEGEPFYSIGINFFSQFAGVFANPLSGIDECDRVFKLLNEHDIKYCRVNFGMFWPNDYANKENNLKEYYMFMDLAVQKAEEYDIGLICSMFWNVSGLSDYLDEPTGEWGNPDSKTREYMREHTATVVNRYKDSPAIWGWEFGNELNLSLDLPNRKEFHGETTTTSLGSRPTRGDEDDLFTDKIMPAVKEWAEIVDANDPHDRMITVGNSEPRPSQWHQYHYDNWGRDSVEEMGEILGIHNPAPCNVTSIHTYGILERFPGSETHIGVLTAFRDEALKNNQPLFIGEFSGLSKDDGKKTIDAVVELNIQLSAIWAIGNVEHSLDNDPAIRDEMLDYIQQANAKLANATPDDTEAADLEDYIPAINLHSTLHSEKVNTTPNFEIPEEIYDMSPAFTLSPLLTDGGVLQAQMPVRLWGSYYDGDTKIAVRVVDSTTGEADTYYTETKDGFFELYINAYEYGGPYNIEYISEEGYRRNVVDVFFGEVVICAGQSNMGWAIGQCYDGTTEKMLYQDIIDNSYNEAIRRLIVWPNSGEEPLDELAASSASGWSFANPYNLKDYSATAYFYARELNARYGIHVGLVSVCMGGTSIYTWFPKEDAARLELPAAHQPSIWHNTMVNPVRRMTARGTIWYQGEGHYDGYAELLAELITSWRREFENDDMYFSVVQLPRYQNERSYFLCREQDKKVCTLVDNVTYSVNIDNGLYPENKAEGDTLNDDGIHPYEKEPVGTRLAHATMEAFFGAKGIWRSPYKSDVSVKDGKVVVKFENVGYGLTLVGLAGFEVAGSDGKWHDAIPAVEGKDTIILTCDEVKEPVSVRYGYSNYSSLQEKPVTSCAQSVCVYNTKDGGNTVAYPAEQFEVRKIGK